MKAFKIMVVIVFVGAVGFVTWNLVRDSGKKYYSTTKAKVAMIEEKLYLSGLVYPEREIDIKSQISGVVDAVFVGVGDEVKEGTPIASVSLVPNSSEVEQLKSNVNIMRINLSAATVGYERQKMLYEKKAISIIDFEAAEKGYFTAKENYASAVRQLNLRLKKGGTADNIVRSTTTGVVIDIPVKMGASVVERSNFNAGSTVATIASADHYIFKADVPEKSIGRLSVGMPVKISLLAYDDIAMNAVIENISAKGEMRGGAVKFPVEAVFVLEDHAVGIRSGYSATAEIILCSVEDALTLPEKCINFKGDTTFVYVTDSLEHIVVEKKVSLGLSDGDKVQITEGIGLDDIIVTNYHD